LNQEIVREMLGNFGCIVDVVTNGKEALEIVFHHPYDLVLMDCQMPGMDGYEATKKIREMEASTGINGSAPECTSRRIPIIALTAHAMKRGREKCLAWDGRLHDQAILRKAASGYP
jgi:two-component system, sensor histidine kinase